MAIIVNRILCFGSILLIIVLMISMISIDIACAQGSTSTITGIVTDSTRDPVPGATITLSSNGIADKIVYTGVDGIYSFTGLSAGLYNVTADIEGHAWTSQAVIGNGQIYTVNIAIPDYEYLPPVVSITPLPSIMPTATETIDPTAVVGTDNESGPTQSGSGIIPVAGAMVLSIGVGLIAAFLSRLAYVQAIIDKVQEFINGFVKQYMSRLISVTEVKARHIEASPKETIAPGVSLKDASVAIISAILLGFAFLFAKKLPLSADTIALYILMAGLVTVTHELAHMVIAYRYKANTEYKIWGLGAILLFATSLLFGTVFAAPARTIINNTASLGKRNVGVTMLAGSAVSIALACVFLLVALIGGGFIAIGMLGVSMCLLSVVYSMMPFEPMEGKKVFEWNKLVWAIIFLPALCFYVGLMLLVIYK